MKSFKQFIGEMAMPRETDRSKVYYHGTTKEIAAVGIFLDGLDPGATEFKYDGKRSANNFKPQANRVYLTPNLSYAMVYGIGGDMAGHDVTRDIKTLGQYGYVFEFDGSSFKDIVPDEDSIGEFLCRWWSKSRDYYEGLYPGWYKRAEENHTMWNVATLAQKHLTTAQIKRIKDGEIEYWAKGGKRLIPFLSDELKFKLIDLGAHVAHDGKLMPKRCWRFDRHDVVNMKKDGSNFFDYAKEWKP